jgi:hypothetical protein
LWSVVVSQLNQPRVGRSTRWAMTCGRGSVLSAGCCVVSVSVVAAIWS